MLPLFLLLAVTGGVIASTNKSKDYFNSDEELGDAIFLKSLFPNKIANAECARKINLPNFKLPGMLGSEAIRKSIEMAKLTKSCKLVMQNLAKIANEYSRFNSEDREYIKKAILIQVFKEQTLPEKLPENYIEQAKQAVRKSVVLAMKLSEDSKEFLRMLGFGYSFPEETSSVPVYPPNSLEAAIFDDPKIRLLIDMRKHTIPRYFSADNKFELVLFMYSTPDKSSKNCLRILNITTETFNATQLEISIDEIHKTVDSEVACSSAAQKWSELQNAYGKLNEQDKIYTKEAVLLDWVCESENKIRQLGEDDIAEIKQCMKWRFNRSWRISAKGKHFLSKYFDLSGNWFTLRSEDYEMLKIAMQESKKNPEKFGWKEQIYGDPEILAIFDALRDF